MSLITYFFYAYFLYIFKIRITISHKCMPYEFIRIGRDFSFHFFSLGATNKPDYVVLLNMPLWQVIVNAKRQLYNAKGKLKSDR